MPELFPPLELYRERGGEDPLEPLARGFRLLLRHLRAEAHRFAITYHRRLRTRRSLSFGLDERILETLGRP